MLDFESVTFNRVRLNDKFLVPRIAACKTSTIPSSMQQTIDTGRLDAFKLDWKPGMPKQPHVFWDSDTAKVMEGMAYVLSLYPDTELEKTYDEWVDLVVSAQQPDGYLNTHFTTVEPEKRFSNLCDWHELYCAGHLMEAAVAGFESLGKRKFLDCMIRYGEYLYRVFGNEPGKRRGWPGHEEIELALVKMYKATGNEHFRELASYFINDRGTEPNVFTLENEGNRCSLEIRQAEKPVREQTDAHGHSVRAVYLYAGMADVAKLNNDETLLKACETLFHNIASRRMYVTGSIGATFQQEAFLEDYNLSNGTLMYAESCAAMGLAQFARRMFNLTGNSKYMDVAELTIYNGALSGISLSGDRFFYTNYLEVDDNLHCYNSGSRERQPWFGCSCCPTSYCRFIPQLGSFLYSSSDKEIAVLGYAANTAELPVGDKTVKLTVSGDYPYDGKICIEVGTDVTCGISLRIPDWCRSWSLKLNGESMSSSRLERNWKAGDVLELDLAMPVECMHANPKVTDDLGKIALKRGPVVYALEEIDQKYPNRKLVLKPSSGFRLVPANDLPEGTLAIEGTALHEIQPSPDELYFTGLPAYEPVTFRAVPYAMWQNRGATNMMVWMRYDGTAKSHE